MAHHDHHATDNIRTAFFLNLVFTVVEIGGGLYTNSLAIITDALHDLGDSLSLGLAWYFEKLSGKKRDSKFSFGYKRFSVLGAIINAIILVSGSVIILFEAIPRLIDPQDVDSQGMLILAILGIVFNGAAILRLKGNQSINSKMIMLHLLEDVLGWVAVLIGSIVLIFTDLTVIDPLLSLGITIFILYSVIRNLKKSLKIVLQGIPPEIELNKIEQQMLTVEGVDRVHDLHVWSLDGEYHVLSVHLVVNQDFMVSEIADIKTKVKEKLKKENIKHFTIEVECVEEDCSNININPIDS